MTASKHSRTLLAALFAACTLLAACGGGGGSDTPPGNPTDPANPDRDSTTAVVGNEVVLKLFLPTDRAAVQAQYGLTLIDQFGQRPIYRMRAAATGGDTEAFADTLQADPRVEFAEPNYLNQTPESRRRRIWAIGSESASTFATQWNRTALRLPAAQAISTGSNITVAVLDTGVDTAHPALAGRLVGGFDFVDFDADASEEGADPESDLGYGHGTHVASLVAQAAPGARIMPVRVLDEQGEGNIWVLAEGLLHAIDPDGDPSTDDGAQVINVSLGTTNESDLIEDILEIVTCDDDDDDDALRCDLYGGSVVVGAAGNSGDTTRHYPAAEDEDGVIAVAASNEARALAEFSTRGTWVQLTAPGDNIIGAVPGNRYAVWSGTSMAAPMVAGAAALLRSQQPTWSPTRVYQQLRNTAVPLCSGTPSQIDPAAALGAAPLAPAC